MWFYSLKTGAVAAGVGGVEIDLGEAGGASGEAVPVNVGEINEADSETDEIETTVSEVEPEPAIQAKELPKLKPKPKPKPEIKKEKPAPQKKVQATKKQPKPAEKKAIADWLNKHKQYPRCARQRRQEGTVKVRFVIDRNGCILSHQIIGSSGHRLLDKEVQAMLTRASPMLPIPPELQMSQLTISVPVAFSLR